MEIKNRESDSNVKIIRRSKNGILPVFARKDGNSGIFN